MNERVFLDTNIFLYGVGQPHPLKESCLRILLDVEQERLDASINSELLQEILYRYGRLQRVPEGLDICRTILSYPLRVLPVTESDIRTAMILFGEFHATGLHSRDAIHIATMQNNGLTQLISADRAFDSVPAIVRIDPINYVSVR